MTPTTQPDAVAELVRLNALAAPGPWEWKQVYELAYRVDEDDEDESDYELGANIETRTHWAITDPESDAGKRVTTANLVSTAYGPASGFLDDPNVQLVVASRNALPSLLTELETLRADKSANAGLVEIGRLAVECKARPRVNVSSLGARMVSAIASYRAGEKGASRA